MTITELFKKSVDRFKDRPALIIRPRYRTITWSYNDLGCYVFTIAELLKKEGVKPGDKIILLAPNSPYWVGAFFGVELCGAIVVPLSAESSQEFIKKIITQTETRILLTHSGLKQTHNNISVINIDLVTFSNTVQIPNTLTQNDKDCAEIIYTSGTTGEPKGVMLTHKNIISNIEALSEIIPVNEEDSFLSILPLSHMFEQVGGMLYPLSQGARIIYLPRVASGLIIDAFKEHRVTKLVTVPQFLETVMKKIELQAEEKGSLKTLQRARQIAEFLPFPIRRILFHKITSRFGGRLATIAPGGAPLNQVLEKKWELLGIQILQGYGLTETSPTISVNTYRAHCFGSVGKPLKNVKVEIAKDGEILVKGPNVFSGYFKDDEKTKASFTDDGYLKTGDIGEIDQDGFLYIRGRKKYMILGPSGQNIYPEDIEFELNKETGIRDSTVVGLEEDNHIKIHAVLLLETGAQADSSAMVLAAKKIIENTNKRLASFQQIQDYSVWPYADFPRSATRKVQKEKVLQWLKTRASQKNIPSHSIVTPLTSMLGNIFDKDPETITYETRLVQDLGLDSLLRIELVTRIEETFGVQIEENKIRQETNVKDLEHLIQKSSRFKKPKTTTLWITIPLIQKIRNMVQWFFLGLPVLLVSQPKILSDDIFKNLKPPFIIMPNHRSYFDSLLILWALPRQIRKRTAIAAASDILRHYWLVSWMLKLIYAAFPFPREEKENVEVGFETVGKLLDKGWSVIIYPEGQMSETKKLLAVKRGAGLLGIEMGVPIIPVFMDNTQEIIPCAKILPRGRGKVTVCFGTPLYFKKNDSYIEAAKNIETALQELQKKYEN